MHMVAARLGFEKAMVGTSVKIKVSFLHLSTNIKGPFLTQQTAHNISEWLK